MFNLYDKAKDFSHVGEFILIGSDFTIKVNRRPSLMRRFFMKLFLGFEYKEANNGF